MPPSFDDTTSSIKVSPNIDTFHETNVSPTLSSRIEDANSSSRRIHSSDGSLDTNLSPTALPNDNDTNPRNGSSSSHNRSLDLPSLTYLPKDSPNSPILRSASVKPSLRTNFSYSSLNDTGELPRTRRHSFSSISIGDNPSYRDLGLHPDGYLTGTVRTASGQEFRTKVKPVKPVKPRKRRSSKKWKQKLDRWVGEHQQGEQRSLEQGDRERKVKRLRRQKRWNAIKRFLLPRSDGRDLHDGQSEATFTESGSTRSQW